jgi:transcriptional regulator with XRE-family HTH domain
MRQSAPFGRLLQERRRTRGLSQLELSAASGVSTRHLSFIETGRSVPSRDMVIRLAEELRIPAPEQNTMLLAAGYAPAHHSLRWLEPGMEPLRRAVDLVLAKHLPYPATVMDRCSYLVAGNCASEVFFELVSPHLVTTGDMLRIVLHPDGLAPHLVNHAEVRRRLLAHVRRQVAAEADPYLSRLLSELDAYPCPAGAPTEDPFGGIVLSTIIRNGDRTLSFISTVQTFGTEFAPDVPGLNLLTFYPADDRTAETLRERFEDGCGVRDCRHAWNTAAVTRMRAEASDAEPSQAG